MTPPNSHDVRDKHAAFKETTDGDAIGDRVEGYLDCGGNFTGGVKPSPNVEQVISYECKKNEAKDTCH